MKRFVPIFCRHLCLSSPNFINGNVYYAVLCSLKVSISSWKFLKITLSFLSFHSKAFMTFVLPVHVLIFIFRKNARMPMKFKYAIQVDKNIFLIDNDHCNNCGFYTDLHKQIRIYYVWGFFYKSVYKLISFQIQGEFYMLLKKY